MENVIYDLTVKGKTVKVVSNGQTFTSEGSGLVFGLITINIAFLHGMKISMIFT